MTTVVYILLHLDSVLNELFSRLFIFLLLLPVINDKFSNFQIHFSQNNVCHLYRCCTERLKYQRGISVLTGLSYRCEAATIGLGTAGVTLLTTVIATPVVIAMEGVALRTGGISVVFNLVCDKVLSIKARKHIRIMMLAEAKINTTSDHISKARKDNHVSDDEFSLIMSELDEFNLMKDEIVNKTKTKTDDETKQSLIKQGKEQAVEQLQNMFGKTYQ
jgi:hypothetical protein